MNIKDLKQYLNTFSNTDGLGIIITNPSKRSYYPITAIHLLSDLPCICIEVDKSLNIDEENLKHVTLDDQMQVTDFI